MKIGIDIGTTYSAVSYVNREYKTVLVKDTEFGAITTPSVVWLGNSRCLVGQSALDRISIDPESILCWLFKREIGNNEVIISDHNNNDWTAEGLTALVIKKMINDSEKQLEKKVTGATITVPVHFNMKQRSGVINAAKMAGLDMVEILDEPVAAAIHYGYSQLTADSDKKILVFDLGGGTFDVTILLLNKKGFYTLASHGDTNVGGQDIDRIIMRMVSEYIKDIGAFVMWDAYNNQLLRKAAEKIKIAMNGWHGDYRANIILSNWSGEVVINKESYDRKVYDFFDKCFESTKACIKEASLNIEDIDHHIFVGGSCKNSLLRRCYESFFDTPSGSTSLFEPDIAISHGAAIYGDRSKMNNDQSFSELRGVIGYNLGLKIYNTDKKCAEIETIIVKNSPLPSINKRVLYKSHRNQEYIDLHVVSYVEHEADLLDIGELKIGPLRQSDYNYEIELNVTVAKDGRVEVEVIDLQTGDEINKTLSYLDDYNQMLVRQKLIIDKLVINRIKPKMV